MWYNESMSEFIGPKTFNDTLYAARDDTAETARLLDVGLQLDKSILDYLGVDDPSNNFTEADIDLVDNARAVTEWLCINMPQNTPQEIGALLEATRQERLGPQSYMDVLFDRMCENTKVRDATSQMVMLFAAGRLIKEQ